LVGSGGNVCGFLSSENGFMYSCTLKKSSLESGRFSRRRGVVSL
jgi:hypothetical protein